MTSKRIFAAFGFVVLALLLATPVVFAEGVIMDGNSHPAQFCVSSADRTVPIMCTSDPTTYYEITVPGGHPAVASGVITVTTAGTSVQGTSVATKECYFTGLTGNTLQCFIGAASGDNRSKGLVIGEAQAEGPIHVTNLNLLWFDCGTSGNSVAYFCTK